MEFFSKAFTWLAGLSQKLPQIDYKTYFIVVLAVIAGTAGIVALTMLGSHCRKIMNASKRIIKYLADKDSVDDDNVGDFTTRCFSSNAPQSMRDAWVQFLGIRFGYPSEIVSEQNVFDKEVKRHRDIRANVFILIALVLVAAFAFWGFGTLSSNEMAVIHCLGLLLSGILYFVLVMLERKQYKRALEAFNNMQEDLDAKVNLQVERNYAVDSSPIMQISAIIDEIIARNTSKFVDEEGMPSEDELTAQGSLEASEGEAPAPDEQVGELEQEATQEDTEHDAQMPEESEQEETLEDEQVEEELLEEELEEAPDEEFSDEIEKELEENAEEETADIDETQAVVPVEGEEEGVSEEELTEEMDEAEQENSDEDIEDVELDDEIFEEELEEVSEEHEEGEEAPIDAPNHAKLAKMPAVIDLMMMMDLSTFMKMNFAISLLAAYSKSKDDPEKRAILKECMRKIVNNIQTS